MKKCCVSAGHTEENKCMGADDWKITLAGWGSMIDEVWKKDTYLVVWGHDEATWGSGGRDNPHLLQGRALGVAVVRVACVPRPICVVVSLLLLLVLLFVRKRNCALVSFLSNPFCLYEHHKKTEIFWGELLCLPYPLAPLLLRTPFWGRGSGSLQTHWRRRRRPIINPTVGKYHNNKQQKAEITVENRKCKHDIRTEHL